MKDDVLLYAIRNRFSAAPQATARPRMSNRNRIVAELPVIAEHPLGDMERGSARTGEREPVWTVLRQRRAVTCAREVLGAGDRDAPVLEHLPEKRLEVPEKPTVARQPQRSSDANSRVPGWGGSALTPDRKARYQDHRCADDESPHVNTV